MQKTVNAKAKAALKSNAMVQDLDVYSPRHHHFSLATLAKVQTQRFHIQKSKLKQSRPKESKAIKGKISALPHFEFTKPGKTSHIYKKKKYFKKKWD